MGGEPPATFGAGAGAGGQGTDGDDLTVDLELDPLSGPDGACGDGVVAGLEGDQGVLPDPAQVLVGDQVGQRRQRQQGSPVGLAAEADDLAVGAVDLAAADRQPGLEGPVELGDRVEGPAGDHVVAHDVDLPLDASFAGRSV